MSITNDKQDPQARAPGPLTPDEIAERVLAASREYPARMFLRFAPTLPYTSPEYLGTPLA